VPVWATPFGTFIPSVIREYFTESPVILAVRFSALMTVERSPERVDSPQSFCIAKGYGLTNLPAVRGDCLCHISRETTDGQSRSTTSYPFNQRMSHSLGDVVHDRCRFLADFALEQPLKNTSAGTAKSPNQHQDYPASNANHRMVVRILWASLVGMSGVRMRTRRIALEKAGILTHRGSHTERQVLGVGEGFEVVVGDGLAEGVEALERPGLKQHGVASESGAEPCDGAGRAVKRAGELPVGRPSQQSRGDRDEQSSYLQVVGGRNVCWEKVTRHRRQQKRGMTRPSPLRI